ncbi:MAG TPA: DNA-binding protein [Pusillimonas sp.]|nr:DNA-binding protein [Pusillimonas sp.]
MIQQKFISTKAYAELVGMKPDSLRVALYRSGHWCGIQPVKLPNKRLLWPADSVDQLIGRKGVA